MNFKKFSLGPPFLRQASVLSPVVTIVLLVPVTMKFPKISKRTMTKKMMLTNRPNRDLPLLSSRPLLLKTLPFRVSVYESDLSAGLKPGTLPAETPVCKSMFEINEDTEISSSIFGATDGTWYIAKDSDNAIYPFFATDIKVESTEDQTIGQLKLYYYKKKDLR